MISFPSSPSDGQIYTALNGVTYQWVVNRWSNKSAIQTGNANYYFDGGNSSTPDTEIQLDGGTA